ncbi:MAG: GNAT family N-acetyltransferase [Rhodospirillaceae bacterium TMED8]|nr:GNAT family N-acetyltransferase [Magnetovibrio sp.]OUT49063.1 MAG: GNAT family N-acetyltransferase [Rhodospirillaceae bacterium TMED8]
MSDKVMVRDARHQDIPAIQSIYAYHVLHGVGSWEKTPPEIDEMVTRHDTITKNKYPYYVGTIDGEVLGYAYVCSYRPRPAYQFTVENSVYVANDAARRGIGLTLLDALISQCTFLGFRRMVAIIGDSANYPSIGLHKKAGFHHVGIIPACGFKHEKWLDQVIMQRAL